MKMRHKFPRVYHPWWLWEEVKANMWGEVNDRKRYLRKAVKFTGDYKLYGKFMMRVVNEWRYSCENALTDHALNRRAWVGHAACAMAIACPENITRQAWGMLTDEQRILANKEADRAIRVWENSYAKSIGLSDNMGTPLLC
jgi:hypothetical protein